MGLWLCAAAAVLQAIDGFLTDADALVLGNGDLNADAATQMASRMFGILDSIGDYLSSAHEESGLSPEGKTPLQCCSYLDGCCRMHLQ